MNNTVYLIAQPTVARKTGKLPNLEPLAMYGEVCVCIPAGEYPTHQPQRTITMLAQKLKDFNPDRDFLVWAGGDTLAAVMVGAVLYEMGIDEVTWLRYERGRDPETGERTDLNARYTPIRVPLFSHEGTQA